MFFLSGLTGLLYEVTWLRMLNRLLGSTVYASSTVLAAFMGGLAAGSFLAGRFVDQVRRPLVLYALLELGIGATALLSLRSTDWLLPIYRILHGWSGDSQVLLTGARSVTALLLLLLPTALMGATLPTLCVLAGSRERYFAQHVSVLYAMNTLGAVVGVLLAGFVLIGGIGESGTIAFGVVLNVAIVLGAFRLGRSPRQSDINGPVDASEEFRRLSLSTAPHHDEGRVSTGYSARIRWVVLWSVSACGFLALACEVVWGRMLLLYQGTSVYAFSAMLAVVLGAMGIGSLVGGRVVESCRDPLRLLAHLQLAVGISGLASLHFFDSGDIVKPNLSTGQNLYVMGIAPVVLLGPMGFLWGMSFPVAVRSYIASASGLDRGRSVAELYSWNTLGGILGASMGGFVLVPWLGVSGSATMLASASLFLGFALLLNGPGQIRQETKVVFGCLVTSCALLVATVGDPYSRLLRRWIDRAFPLDLVVYNQTEGPSGFTTAFGVKNGDRRSRQLWIDGEGMTILITVTKLMAHLPVWLADDPKEILVVCFGMGTTVRSATRHKGLEVWAVELVPSVIQSFGYFHPEGPALLKRPDVHTVVDDGRNFLLMDEKKYAVITVDPAPPLYSAGAVNLYSREFFQICKERLRPHGIMCMWVPEANASETKAILRTFVEVFEHMSLWESPPRHLGSGGFYLIGSNHPLWNIKEKIHDGFRNQDVRADLEEWGNECDQPEKVLDLYVTDGERLRTFLAKSPVITDDRPFTEFPLWRAITRAGEYQRLLNGPRLRSELDGVNIR